MHSRTHRPRSASAAVLAALAGVGLAAAALTTATPGTLRTAFAPHAAPDALVAAVAAVVAWGLVARLTLGLLATLAAMALRGTHGLAGRLAVRCAEVFTPALLHGLVRAALATVAVGAPAALAPALVPAVALADPGPPTVPVLDRVPGTVAAAPAAEPVAATVVVRPGDSLWRIAAAHLPPGAGPADVAAAWPAWYAANRATIGTDPGLIRPGQVLTAPDGPGGSR
jgi:nucleoid-associated protein YgaU